ncbi:hypothetical protein [Desulfovibrio cuneatus]|uniref:hypothetical protein n=1 Tax=Desulfovibrio cuneatus TaxID=159728 RepID=UPI0003FF9ABF|nr:hypothetical protein [Desulfovibrio cuneatus]
MAHTVFTQEWLDAQFPADRADAFFDALFGGAEEGAYDIRLCYVGSGKGCADFAFELHQRPGKCLVCSLTYGLPQVFTRHPIINVRGLAAQVAQALGKAPQAASFSLGATQEISAEVHRVPLRITFSD